MRLKRFFSIARKIILVGVGAILLLVAALLGLFWYFSRLPSDRQLITEQFDSQIPGYSRIEILQRTGEHTIRNPRILVVEVVIESYPESVTCQGEIHYFRADPSYREFGWYNWECVGHWILVERARSALRSGEGPSPCQAQIKDTALVLERWVENGWVSVDQIHRSEIRRQVERLLEGDVLPMNEPIMLFDVSEAQVHDLVPELLEQEKVPTYVLRCDGTLELFLRGGERWWEQPMELQVYDVVLPTPVEEPVIRP